MVCKDRAAGRVAFPLRRVAEIRNRPRNLSDPRARALLELNTGGVAGPCQLLSVSPSVA